MSTREPESSKGANVLTERTSGIWEPGCWNLGKVELTDERLKSQMPSQRGAQWLRRIGFSAYLSDVGEADKPDLAAPADIGPRTSRVKPTVTAMLCIPGTNQYIDSYSIQRDHNGRV